MDVLNSVLPGRDRIAENGSHEIVLSDGGYLFLGTADGTDAGGHSDVYDPNLHTGNRLIYYVDPCGGFCAQPFVEAENVYWGSASGPPAGAFGGLTVDTSPFLTSPATGANRPASPVVAAAGETIEDLLHLAE